MIFVTVGTHEQPFDRLIQCVDELKGDGGILEDVIVQTGYCTYEPKHCVWQKFFPYQQMVTNVANAHIVITHGGPSSFIMPLQIGKIPIVVPRQKKYDEHVNDHQVEFCRAVKERYGNILLCENEKELRGTITHYDNLIEGINGGNYTHTDEFNRQFAELIKKIM